MPRTLTDEDVEAIAQRVVALMLVAAKPVVAIFLDGIYTVDAASSALSIHPETLTRWLRAGVVRGSRKLGSWRIIGADLLKCG